MNDAGGPRGDSERLASAVARVRSLGITRIESYAWRDLDDPEAGGSEVHADEIFSRWAAAGLAVHHRTSTFDSPRQFTRNGYSVEQRGGRFDVFARVIARQAVRRRPPGTATIEIWNGVPWLGPLWAPHCRVVWMHHVHREMWDDALPVPLNHAGRLVETRLAPLVYRRSRFATLSESSADEIVGIGIPRSRMSVIPPGVHERFTPDPARRSTTPLVVVVGRLAPVKRQSAALDALAIARREVPDLTVELVSDGPDRRVIEAWIAAHDAADWVTMRGRVSDEELVDAYRRAWLVVSASYAEGWGMSLTEGGACGTPCVATDIAGHRGAAVPDVTGRLVPLDRLGTATAALLQDAPTRERFGAAAIEHAAELSWTSVAGRHLDVLADAIVSRPGRRGGGGGASPGRRDPSR